MEPFLPRTRFASIHQVWRSWSSFPKGLYSEEQLTSYEAQVDYYTRFIRSNPDWEFVDVYTDEGISTLNTRHRDGFNRMIEDALAGKINLIVTKIVCGDCGEYYGPKVWHSTDKYRRVIWQCNGKFKGEHRCSTPHLYEEDIKCLFLQAVADLTEAREVLMETCQMLLDEYLNTESLDAESAALETEMGTD